MKVLTPASQKDAPTQKYLLTGNKHFGRNASGDEVMYESGDMVPLTDAQYEAFKDKFEDPEQTKRKASKAKANADEATKLSPEDQAKADAAKKAAEDAAKK